MFKLFYKVLLLGIVALSVTLLYQKHTYAYHTLTHIDPLPHTKALIIQEKYADAQEYLEYFMQFDYVSKVPEAQVLLKNIKTKRASFRYQSNKVFEGITKGNSDELSGQISAIGSDFFLIGDLRDLAIQGKHYLKDEEVDKVLVSLSTIGLVASAGTLLTLGAGSTVKGGISILKIAQKNKCIPPWLSKYLVHQAKQIKRTKSIKTVKPLLKNIEEIYKQAGLNNTLKLLSGTNDIKALQSISKFTKRYGKNSSIMLDLSKGKLLTHAQTFKQYNKNTILLASSYGDSGYKVLLKGGERNFIKSIKRIKAYSKTGYKNEIWKVFIRLMKHLSDTVLIAVLSIASFLLFPLRKLFTRHSRQF